MAAVRLPFSFSENPVTNEVNVFLEGPDCNATVASLGFGQKDTSICDNTVFISHQEESSKSRQIIKNAFEHMLAHGCTQASLALGASTALLHRQKFDS